MTARSEIRFLLNDSDVTLQSVGASDTLLDYLRIERRLTGTKEGCAEGDCGACTVLVGRLQRRCPALRAGQCLHPLSRLARRLPCGHGRISSGPIGRLHPVQQAMVEHHGSQCGFCTPGFVMSLYALWMENPDPTREPRSRRRCRATCAAAPATRRSSARPVAVTALGSPAEDALTTRARRQSRRG